MNFRAVLQLHGKTATGIEVPAEVVEALGSGKRPAVVVTIGGHSYRSTVAPMGGVFLLPVAAEHRIAAGVGAGEEIEVGVELDTAPREVEVPADLNEALDADPEARRFFDGLSYSNKRRHILAIVDAKSAETRRRRIEKSIALFHEGKV